MVDEYRRVTEHVSYGRGHGGERRSASLDKHFAQTLLEAVT